MVARACIDCGGKLELRGWTTGSVCHRCRAARAHQSAMKGAAMSGKVFGSTTGYDPLEAKKGES